jgi:hypothetical protein
VAERVDASAVLGCIVGVGLAPWLAASSV